MKELTLEQKRAIEETEGTVCIKAGAGTGKTSVLVERYLRVFFRLLESGLTGEEAIESIVAVTFTNKASEEMRERLEKELAKVSDARDVLLKKAYISTIDSLCTRLLRENALEIGLEPNFRVINEIEAKILFLKMGREKLKKGTLPRIVIDQWVDDFLAGIYEYIVQLRNMAISPEEFLRKIPLAKEEGKRDLGHFILELYVGYEEELERRSYLDFSGILLKTLEMFRRNKKVREKYRKKFRYVLVDEYQDTTPLQDKLLREFSPNYFIVGDTKQSIYGFRGARPENVEELSRVSRLTLSLTKNFRSYNQILEVINRILREEIPNYEPISSDIEGKGYTVEVFLADSQEEEAEFIAQRILQLLADWRPEGGRELQLKDIAILLRVIRTPVGIYEEALRRHGIPFVTTGGTGYYERPEVRDMVALLSAISNPFDDLSLVRLLRSPICRAKNSVLSAVARVFPEKEIDDEEKMVRKRHPLYDALGHIDDLDIDQKDKEALKNCKELLDRFFWEKHNCSLGELVYKLLRESNYLYYIQTLPPVEKRRSMANIKKLLGLVREFEERNIFSTLEDFIAYVKEVTEQEAVESEAKLEEENCVRIMSIHQAKGLEFPIVFLANVRDKIFPFQGGFSPVYEYDEELLITTREERKKKNKEADIEEKRLFYVACTRAREKLVISGSKNRQGKQSSFFSYFFDEEGRVKADLAHLVEDRRDRFLQEKEFWERQIMPGREKENARRQFFPDEIRKTIFSLYEPIPSFQISPPSFTVTQLAVFEQCPLRYKYLYLLNLPPDPGVDKAEETVEESVFGTIIHKTLEEYVLYGKEGEEWNEDDFIRKFRSLAKSHGISDEDIRKLYDTEARHIFQDFMRNIHNRVENIVAVEIPFHIFIGDWEVRGIIDRIDKVAGDGYHIIDYKTNRQKKEQLYILPMVIYRLAAEKLLGYRPVQKASLYWLRHDEVVPLEVSKEMEESVEERVKTIIRRIQEENFTPVTTPHGCDFCDYRCACEMYT